MTMPSAILSPAPGAPLHGTELCVACGLCLPHCPTYRLTLDEAESPRGRIALMRALARNDLPFSPTAEAHLQRCLVCRACEKVCPSRVPYGQLMDATQELVETRRPATGLQRSLRSFLLDRLIANPAGLRRAGRLLYGYQRSGLQRLLRASGFLSLLGLRKAEALLPQLSPATPTAEFHPAAGERKGAVALFTGCVAGVFDDRTQKAAIRLLNALGYDVHVPPLQGCCGALHLRTGETEKAHALMRRNLEAFAGKDLPVVTTASGCGALLREYDRHITDNEASSFADRVTDIGQFLAWADWRGIRLRPLPRRVAVHDPCTLANVLRQEQAPYILLKKIPEAKIAALPENSVCCGGAGAYPLTQPDMAQRLRRDKIRHLREMAPDILVTSNIGCALHLGAGIREAGLDIEVLHPVVLLARQIRGARNEGRE
jgi:glycolate oxidase iron-sulfur subunit